MAELRKRSEIARGPRGPVQHGQRPAPGAVEPERTPDGTINNCALANGEPEAECQMCGGACPDHDRFRMAKHAGLIAPRPEITAFIEEHEQRAGERAFAEAAGQSVEVTWGEELFQPVQFNAFRVGPFKATTVVRAGESVGEALLRLHREIAATAQAIRQEKADDYVKALAAVSGMAARTRV